MDNKSGKPEEENEQAQEELQKRYIQTIRETIEDLDSEKQGSDKALLFVLTNNNRIRMNRSVAIWITCGFRCLTDRNAILISAMEAASGKADSGLIVLQAMCRIEFAKFLTYMGTHANAHAELNDAGDEISKLFDRIGTDVSREDVYGLAMELGRMKDLVQTRMVQKLAGGQSSLLN